LEIDSLSGYSCEELSDRYDEIFSGIVEIHGYLKITNSMIFNDLNAFKSLRRITGRPNSSLNDHALIVKDNRELKFLWLPDQHVSTEGSSLIVNNPKLCTNCSKITEIKAHPNLYTVNITWSLPEAFMSSEPQSYKLIFWNGTKEEESVCKTLS
jgi:hypothetical protein